jgi:TonB family protein
MTNALIYLLEANVLLLLLTLAYLLVRNQLSFSIRRMMILLIPVFACMVYLLRATQLPVDVEIYHLPVYEANALSLPLEAGLDPGGIYPAYDRIYWMGAILMVVVLSWRVFRVQRRLRSIEAEESGNVKIVRMANENCFSFMNYIQVNPELSEGDQRIVLEHERLHVSKRHSYDILFMQLVHAFNWFNPVIIFLKKELMRVHEYQVDEIMYSSHKTGYMEFLLAYSMGANTTPYLLTNQFYSTKLLVKRMDLMRKKTKNRVAFSLALPIVAGAFALVSWTITEGSANHVIPGMSLESQKLYGNPDKAPEFVGGFEALAGYLEKNIVYPPSAKEEKIQGTVYTSFVITTTGDVTDCKVLKSVHETLDNEALRVVAAMPDWIPGEKDGKKVSAEMTLPIKFLVPAE